MINQGCFIQDKNGTPFWVLLCQRFIYVYKESDWRVTRLGALIEWMFMPEMIFGLLMESEASQCFEAFNDWQAMPGQLADKPGFQALELFCEIMERTGPAW